MIRRILPAVLCLLGFPLFAQTGYVTMTASNLVDETGAPISNATACFDLVNLAGNHIGVHVGSSAGGQAAPRQACGPVSNGALVGTWQPIDPTAAGTNLVPDPAIANAWTTWSNPGAAWSYGSGSWIPNAGNVNLIEAGSAASGLYQTSQTAGIPVVPGKTYTISGYIDASNASGGDPAWLVSNAGGSFIAGAYQSPGVAGWVQAQFTVPAGVTTMFVEAATRSVTIGSGQFVHWAAPMLQAGSAQLIDTNLSNPQHPGYMLTVTDNLSGSIILGGHGSGYTMLQPQWSMTSPMSCVAGLCNLDSYVPTTTPGVVQQVGPQGPTGPPNALSIGTVSTLSPGSPATASVTGTPPAQTLNLSIPQGANGAAGGAAGSANQLQKNNGGGGLGAGAAYEDSNGNLFAPGFSGTLYADGVTYTTILAAQTAACNSTPVDGVIIPPTSTIAAASTIDDLASPQICPAGTTNVGQPVQITDQRFGERYGRFDASMHISNNQQFLRQVKSRIALMEQTGAGQLVALSMGDSTGDFGFKYDIERLVAAYGLAGWYEAANASGAQNWGGFVTGNTEYTSFPGTTTANWGIANSTSGDCGYNGTLDFTRSPWGYYEALGNTSPTAQCTLTFSVAGLVPYTYGAGMVGNSLQADTVKVWYVTEPGAGTITIYGYDGTNTVQLYSASAASGSTGVGVASLTGLGGIQQVQVTNGTTGRVRLIAWGMRNSAATGVTMIDTASSGIGIDQFFSYPGAHTATIFAAFPPLDWVSSSWKNNTGLTAAQYKGYFQQLYNLVQPYGDGYNATNSPNPADVTYFGTYTDNSGTTGPRDNNSAARQVAEANINAQYCDGGWMFPNYLDETARGLYQNGFGGIHWGPPGQKVYDESCWAEFGLDSEITYKAVNRLRVPQGSATDPAISVIGQKGVAGFYFDGTNRVMAAVGGFEPQGTFIQQAAPVPGAPVVTPLVTGSTTYTYQACVSNSTGIFTCSATTTITNGPATLSASQPNFISIPAAPGANVCLISRNVGGSTQGSIWQVNPCYGVQQSIIDDGLAGNGQVPTAGLVAGYLPWGMGGYTPSQSWPGGFSVVPGGGARRFGGDYVGGSAAMKQEDYDASGGGYVIDQHFRQGNYEMDLPSTSNTWLLKFNGAFNLWFGPGAGYSGFAWSFPGGLPNNSTALIPDSGKLPRRMGSFTTTAVASETYSNVLIYATSSCFSQPTNSAAQTAGALLFSSPAAGSITVSHAATAGMNYDIWCNQD